MNQVDTLDASYRKVVNYLIKNGIKISESVPLNHNRYKIIKAEQGNYLILFKREFFLSFGKIFKSFGESGAGETINKEDLKYAISNGVRNIIITYPSGNIYSISVEDFLMHSHERVNEFENKETRSINIKHLRRENG